MVTTIIQEIAWLKCFAWNTTLFAVVSIIGSAVSAKFIDALGLRKTYISAIAIEHYSQIP